MIRLVDPVVQFHALHDVAEWLCERCGKRVAAGVRFCSSRCSKPQNGRPSS